MHRYFRQQLIELDFKIFENISIINNTYLIWFSIIKSAYLMSTHSIIPSIPTMSALSPFVGLPLPLVKVWSCLFDKNAK